VDKRFPINIPPQTFVPQTIVPGELLSVYVQTKNEQRDLSHVKTNTNLGCCGGGVAGARKPPETQHSRRLKQTVSNA